jgi:hypothetical protein
MFCLDAPVLADHYALGLGVNVDGRPTALALTDYLLLSNRTRQVFETEAGSAWNPSKRPADLWPLFNDAVTRLGCPAFALALLKPALGG